MTSLNDQNTSSSSSVFQFQVSQLPCTTRVTAERERIVVYLYGQTLLSYDGLRKWKTFLKTFFENPKKRDFLHFRAVTYVFLNTEYNVIIGTDRQTSHMARCVTFAVATIRVGEMLHIFPSGTESMWNRGSKKAYTGPTKFGCDRSIVVGCRSRNDRQTSRQTSWNDNKAHSLRTWRNRQRDKAMDAAALAWGSYEEAESMWHTSWERERER